MSDEKDREAQRRLDEEGGQALGLDADQLDPEDDLALYAVIYAALGEGDGEGSSPDSIAAIEAEIERIEGSRLHLVEVLAGAVVVLAGLVAAPAVLGTLATAARAPLDSPWGVATLAAMAAASVTAATDRLVRSRGRQGPAQ